MPDYSIRVYQLNHFLKRLMPDLFYHFKKYQINPDIFFSKWILTLFASYLPFETLAKVWDIFLVVKYFFLFQDKWKSVFRFSLAFLHELKDKLLLMDLNNLSIFLRENSRTLHGDSNIVIKNAQLYKISNKELNQLRDNFFLDQIKFKLNVKLLK